MRKDETAVDEVDEIQHEMENLLFVLLRRKLKNLVK